MVERLPTFQYLPTIACAPIWRFPQKCSANAGFSPSFRQMFRTTLRPQWRSYLNRGSCFGVRILLRTSPDPVTVSCALAAGQCNTAPFVTQAIPLTLKRLTFMHLREYE